MNEDRFQWKFLTLGNATVYQAIANKLAGSDFHHMAQQC